MGRLEVICGPMFSGKTEELLRRLRRHEIAGKSIKLLKPSMDNRYGSSEVVSHAGSKRICERADIKLPMVESPLLSYDVIGIEEAQFFENHIAGFLRVLSGIKIVIITGLDQTFRGTPFGPMPELMAIADKLDKLTAICTSCGEEATKTFRSIDGKPAPFNSPTVLVGGSESYEARCRSCFESAYSLFE